MRVIMAGSGKRRHYNREIRDSAGIDGDALKLYASSTVKI
jgi:hypothetical protein